MHRVIRHGWQAGGCISPPSSPEKLAYLMPSRFSITVEVSLSSSGVLDASLPVFFALRVTGRLCFFMRRRDRPILSQLYP